MKTLLLIGTLLIMGSNVFAQGMIRFENDATRQFIIGQPLRPGDDQGPLPRSPLPSGATIVAGLYGATGAGASQLSLVTSIPLTGTSWLSAGRMAGKNLILSGFPGGTVASFIIVLTDLPTNSWPASVCQGARSEFPGATYFGSSGLFTAVPGSSLYYLIHQTNSPAHSTWPAGAVYITGLPLVRYVSQASTNPVPPYTNWSIAATNIQDAIDVAIAGDLILVTNGVYATGKRGAAGTNRVAVTKPVTVQSVNGPSLTIIDGSADVRCVYLTNEAILSGFTLTNGFTHSGDPFEAYYGGGAFCASSNAMITNCTLTGNNASFGGGVHSGTLYDCTLAGNAVDVAGGGAYNSTLSHCILTGNYTTDHSHNFTGSGGGACSCTLDQCLLTGNSAFYGGGAIASTLNNCTVYGNSAYSIWDENGPIPGVGGGAYSSTLNNCILYFNGADVGANHASSTFNYCCTTPMPSGGTGNIADTPRFIDKVGGNLRLRPGSPCINAANNVYAPAGPDLDGHPRIVFNTVDMGAYEFQGIPPARTLYVDLNSPTPASPYTNWSTAATDIQNAMDAAATGDLILVTNGVYAAGGRVVFGTLTNRVVINKAVTVQSVNGPTVTVIKGYQVPGATNGNGAIRCVYLSNGGCLSGFALTNGATQNWGDIMFENVNGGGCWCESPDEVVAQCVLAGNSAHLRGAGIYGGTLNNSIVISNSGYSGGGAANSTLNHCTLTGNTAQYQGGGTFSSTLNNSIVYYNTASAEGNNVRDSILNYCCTPDPGGAGCITNEPLFVDQAGGNLRLQSNSPCINAGNNTFASGPTDLDGRPRIVGGTVDIGAYEHQTNVSGLFLAWLQQYGLATDGSADYADVDGDRLSNWQEWRSGTVPTDAASVLKMLAPFKAAPGVAVRWQSVAGVNYFLERRADLAAPPAFSSIASNLVGQAGATTYTDTNAVGAGPFFYRIGVQ
jgi:hypothetical protein